jgi:hypothetical protein
MSDDFILSLIFNDLIIVASHHRDSRHTCWGLRYRERLMSWIIARKRERERKREISAWSVSISRRIENVGIEIDTRLLRSLLARFAAAFRICAPLPTDRKLFILAFRVRMITII